MTAELRAHAQRLLSTQAHACRMLGSPLYAQLLDGAAEDAAVGGPTFDVLTPHLPEAVGSALALRLMAAVHRLVLSRAAPRLALHYPSVGGTAGVDGAFAAFRELLVQQRDMVSDLLARPCQTNEVNRCAALLGGFLTVASRTGLGLRCLEVGASAGLQLRWERYRYQGPTAAWGDAASAVQLGGDQWALPDDLLATTVTVAARRGCDVRPIGPTTVQGRLSLTASVWADQDRRFARLRGALAVADAVPAPVDAESVGTWLPARLHEPAAGAATVVFHSVVWQYVAAEDQRAMVLALAAAGQRATSAAPLAWLRMEPVAVDRAMEVRLTTWPGGDEELLATAGAHGDPLHWDVAGR